MMFSARLQALREAHGKAEKEKAEKSDDESDSASSGSIKLDKNEVDEPSSTDEEEEEPEEEKVEEEEDLMAEEQKFDDDNEPLPEASTSLTFVSEALGDFVGEQPNDLSIKKGDLLTVVSMRDDGWWEVENQDRQKGMVPSTFLKVPEKLRKCVDGTQGSSNKKENEHLWGKLRSSVKQAHVIDEALNALGALPVGFCKSTLAELLIEDSGYSTEAFLAPKLSSSGLSFKDIKWNSQTNTLKPVTTRLQRAVRLVAFRQVHPPSSAFDVTSHHVRICLHDGSKALSNVHIIRAKWDPKVPKIWTFLPKISSGGSCLEEGQFFIRSNNTSATLGILFQLCIGYKKPGTGEIGEMSCGWVFMRLLDDSGLSVPNRTKILHIHPGVPFMSQQSSPVTESRGGALKQFMNRGKQPRLVVTISVLKRKNDQLLNLFLPVTMIGPVSSIPILVLYRKILTDKLLKERLEFSSTELVQCPFISNFPKLFSQPDLLDTFRKLWSDKCKKLKHSTLKNEEDKKACFKQLFTETVFLMLQCCSLTPFSFIDEQSQQARKTEIARITKIIKDHGPLAFAVSPEYKFYPLSINSLSIDIIGQHYMSMKGIE